MNIFKSTVNLLNLLKEEASSFLLPVLYALYVVLLMSMFMTIPVEEANLVVKFANQLFTRIKLTLKSLSQLAIADWHLLFSDPIVADAVMDRLVHGSHIIELTTAKSMRSEIYKNMAEK
jgi:DNA replication protein DnaC